MERQKLSAETQNLLKKRKETSEKFGTEKYHDKKYTDRLYSKMTKGSVSELDIDTVQSKEERGNVWIKKWTEPERPVKQY